MSGLFFHYKEHFVQCKKNFLKNSMNVKGNETTNANKGPLFLRVYLCPTWNRLSSTTNQKRNIKITTQWITFKLQQLILRVKNRLTKTLSFKLNKYRICYFSTAFSLLSVWLADAFDGIKLRRTVLLNCGKVQVRWVKTNHKSLYIFSYILHPDKIVMFSFQLHKKTWNTI